MPLSSHFCQTHLALDVEVVQNVVEDLKEATHAHLDFICIPLCNEIESANKLTQSVPYELNPSTESDLVFENSVWSRSVIGKISPWISPDSEKQNADYHIQAMEAQLKWASHLGISSVICPIPSRCNPNYARLLATFYTNPVNTTLMVKIPLSIDEEDGWNYWRDLVTLADFPHHLGVCLEFTDFPGVANLDRWLAEPVKAVILPYSIFLTNRKGYPVLCVAQKKFLLKLFQYKIKVILTVERKVENEARYKQIFPEVDQPANNMEVEQHLLTPLQTYRNYVTHLFNSQDPPTESEQFSYSYLDCLQAPLQPLQENLESTTYETFERDPVKYARYEEAVFQCLMDRKKPSEPSPVVIVVVGAGRGPLVHASLNALERAGVANCEVYAVEKNVNAVFTLNHRVRTDLNTNWRKVKVISGDMRSIDMISGADIMVSELLGSFGDNEVSPECLDGAQKYLKPDGVSIPYEYTSYVEPITNQKLWLDLRGSIKHLDTPYVVKFHAAYYPATKREEKCFTFRHPNFEKDCASKNRRYKQMKFEMKSDAVIHGFAGYFHCLLYKDITISITPSSFSEGMFSWFPIFFPLREPLWVEKAKVLEVHFWRLDDSKRVWYEWCVTSPLKTAIQNVNGRSYHIGK